MDGKWERGATERVFEDEWMNVDRVNVTWPDGTESDHHVMVAKSQEAACVICYDPEKGVLMIWRHRFITDEWGWEFPAGGVDAGESPIQGAEREVLEETGWKPNALTEMISYSPMAGNALMRFFCFYSDGAEWVGPGRDINEAADVAWISLDQLRAFIGKGEIREGMSLTAALFALQMGPLKDR